MQTINKYIHILFRSNSIFLFLGSMLVPVGLVLDVRAAVGAPFILYFQWYWGMIAGTIFGVAFIIAIKGFPILASLTKRQDWLLVGLLLGLLTGALLALVGGADLLREMPSGPGRHNGPIQMLIRTIIMPSAICGCLCAGFMLYPNDLNIRGFNPGGGWAWTDVLWAVPSACLLILKLVVLMYR